MASIPIADRYLVAQMWPRMLAALAVTLVALLIERLLRLMDLVTGQGADLGPLLGMMLNLLPHYLGLALPAAFCIATVSTLSDLSRHNEIDAMEAAGWSLRRIGVPFLVCSLALSMISVALFGFIQPYSRYAFSEIRYALAHSGWKGRVEEGVFLPVGDGMTLSAFEIDASGRFMRDVFLVSEEDGEEVAMTAREGLVLPERDGKSVRLVLRSGQAFTSDGERVDFDTLQIERRFALADSPFRPRGESARELTLTELWREIRRPGDGSAQARFEVEFHGRLVRALSLIGIAMISVPLSVSRKRASPRQRMAVAIALLAIYDNLIKFVSGMGALERIDPETGLWTLFIVFMALAAWLYAATPGTGARSPFLRLYRIMAGLGR